MIRTIFVLLLPAVLAACAAGPDYRRPALPTAHARADAFGSAAAANAAVDAPAVIWWAAFHDPTLDSLVADALAANRDIALARANLRVARAALGETRFGFGPRGEVVVSQTTSRSSGAAQGLAPDVVLEDVDLYDAGVDASWEIDIFGRVRRSSEAARADAQVEFARLQGVRLAIAAETALAYVDLRGAQARMAVARANAESQALTFQLTQALARVGTVSGLDRARAQGLLETTRATIPPLEAAQAAAIFRLGVLTGRGPLDLQARLSEVAPLPVSPSALAVGDPGRLIAARPDIVAAERSLAASTARIGVNTAALFPTLSLVGSFGATALSGQDLNADGATRFSFGPFLSWNWNVFETARRIRQADARAQAALARYEQAVLIALEDVEASLTRLAQERRRAGHLEMAATANAEVARIARQRYRLGVESSLTLLDAERQQLQAEDDLTQSRIQLAREYIAVHRALGAGPPASE